MIWKNGAKTAFAIGFDVDGATIWRNKAVMIDGGDKFLKGPSIGKYGPEVGVPRLLDILDNYDLKATWFIPAENIEKYHDLACIILDRGHELGHHDYDHRGEYGDTPEEQIQYIEKCQDIFLRYQTMMCHILEKMGWLSCLYIGNYTIFLTLHILLTHLFLKVRADHPMLMMCWITGCMN